MSRIRITHTTSYRYSKPVTFGLHRLVVRPREGHDLLVESLVIEVRPGHSITWHRDLFGNSIAMVRLLEESDQLEFCNRVTIQRRDHTSHVGLLDLLPVRLPVEYFEFEHAIVAGYQAPVYPGESAKLEEWAAGEFAPKKGDDAIELMNRMSCWIYKNIKYTRREDRGVQTPLETLKLGAGSCRDMATLLMEATRTAGMAARFASGYLDSPASAAGRAATHAWAEVYFPNHGWFGCDPTIGEATSLKHIVTGVSSHPRGVMPISGSFTANGASSLGLTVSVKIEKLPGEGTLPPPSGVYK